MFILSTRKGVLSLALVFAMPVIAAPPLTLAEAERIAIERDAERERLLDEAGAREDAASAAATLPDPEIRMGFSNVPTDSFALDQQEMTQLVVGFRQVFPPGDSLAFLEQQGKWLAQSGMLQAADRERAVRRLLRSLWLERQAADRRLELVSEVEQETASWLAARQSRYAAGSGQQADYLSAQLKLDRLAERALQVREQRNAVESMLRRYIGAAATADYLPAQMAAPSEQAALLAAVQEHPLLRSADANVEAGAAGEAMAREQFGPRWALDLSYGDRRGVNSFGMERPDFASVMVSVSLPLFNRDQKRREISAAERRTRAATHARIDRLRMLETDLLAAWSRHQDIMAQIALIDERSLPATRSVLEATERAYANSQLSLDALVDAYFEQFELEWRRIALATRRDQLRADLDYLGGRGQ